MQYIHVVCIIMATPKDMCACMHEMTLYTVLSHCGCATWLVLAVTVTTTGTCSRKGYTFSPGL